MTTTQLDEVRRLEAEFAEAMSRLYTVGNGLARLRLTLQAPIPAGTPASPPAPAAPVPQAYRPPAPAASQAPRPSTPPLPHAPEAPAPQAHAPQRQPARAAYLPALAAPETTRWWQRPGAVTRVLAVTGAVVTLVGVAMLLVLAMQRGWFGPVPRVVGGGLLAVALVVGGHLVRGREREAGRFTAGPVALTATGYAAAYLDIVAVTSIYRWLPPAVGLLLTGLVAATGLLTARRWDSQLLAVIVALGAAVLGPVVSLELTPLTGAYLVVLAVATWPAQSDRGWPALTVARVAPASVALPVIALAETVRGRSDMGVHLVLAAALAAVTMLTAVHEVRRAPGDWLATTSVAVTTVPVVVVAGLLTAPGRPVLLGVGAAVHLLAMTLVSRRPVGPVATHLRAAFGVIGTVLGVLALVDAVPEAAITTALLVAAACALAAAAVTRDRLSLLLAGAVAALALTAYLPHPATALVPSTALTVTSPASVLDSLLAGLVVALAVWASMVVPWVPAPVRRLMTFVGWAGALAISATILVDLGLLVGARLGDVEAGFVAGYASATIAWMAAAAWLLLRGLRHAHDRELSLRMGLVIAGLAVGKLVLFDLASLAGIWRVTAFLVVGLLLLVSGTSYTKALERARAQSA